MLCVIVCTFLAILGLALELLCLLRCCRGVRSITMLIWPRIFRDRILLFRQCCKILHECWNPAASPLLMPCIGLTGWCRAICFGRPTCWPTSTIFGSLALLFWV